VIPAYLQTDRFRQLFPVLLHQLASDATRGNLGASELSNFVATVIPKYLDNSIAGKILATPNPVPFAAERVLISWGTNDPGGGEVRLFTSFGEEELITRQPSGQMEIPWISGSMEYEFRLYATSQPDTAIDSVTVRRDLGSTPAVMREIADEVSRGNIDMMELSRFIAAVIPICLKSTIVRELFYDWERHGFHVTPVHFYQPIPDIQNLPKTLWDRHRRVGRLLHDPPFPAAYDHRNWQRLFFSTFRPGGREKHHLGSHLHRTVSSGISQTGLSRVAPANREKGGRHRPRVLLGTPLR